jgi:uroporphyrinogen decarboxylase
MDKQERLTKTIAGEPTDRIPVALWRHWPGDDQRAADFARAVVDFQKTYDWDFVKVTPATSFCVTDYGLQDEWQGDLAGTRAITKRVVTRSLDWTEIRPLDPMKGALGRQLEALRLIGDGLRDDNVPIIQTIFSPLVQARHLGGNELFIRHMRTNPDRVHTALNTLTESTLRFIEALKRFSIAGIYYAIEHASYDTMSEEEYRIFGLPYDRKILESLPEKWWLNILHLDGEAPMFKLCGQLPAQVISWHDQETEPDLAQGKLLFNGAICGGLSCQQHIYHGTPNSIREQVRSVMKLTNNRRFILSAGCAAMISSPLSNFRAVREVVEVVGA